MPHQLRKSPRPNLQKQDLLFSDQGALLNDNVQRKKKGLSLELFRPILKQASGILPAALKSSPALCWPREQGTRCALLPHVSHAALPREGGEGNTHPQASEGSPAGRDGACSRLRGEGVCEEDVSSYFLRQ